MTYKQFENIGTLITFLVGFFLFYSQTVELLGSLAAALLSAALVWISFVMIGWLAQVFTK